MFDISALVLTIVFTYGSCMVDLHRLLLSFASRYLVAMAAVLLGCSLSPLLIEGMFGSSTAVLK